MAQISDTPLGTYTSLQAYYKLEGTNDSTANGFNLTNTGTVTFDSAKYGNGANFTNSNANRCLHINNNVGITGGSITIAGWFTPLRQVGLGETFALFGQGDNTAKVFHTIYYMYQGGSIYFQFSRAKQGIGYYGPFYGATLTPSIWYHVAMTYDGTNVIGYFEGTPIGTTATSGTGVSPGVDQVYIGCENGTNSGFASIKADDVAVFYNALSEAEIGTMYYSAGGTTKARFLGRYW